MKYSYKKLTYMLSIKKICAKIYIKELLSEKKAQVIAFERFNLGEGVEKKQISFADEVAAQTKA